MRKWSFWGLLAVIGVVNAVVLWLFESVGVDGTNWLWNDVFHADRYPIATLILATVGGVLVSLTFYLVKKPRLVPPETDLLQETVREPSTLSSIGILLLLGAVCLLAGASLGPEASLMAFSGALATYLATRSRADKPTVQLLITASVGALLVAFLSSPWMALVPLLLLLQDHRKAKKGGHPAPFPWLAGVACLVASGLAYLTIKIIDRLTSGGVVTPAPPLPPVVRDDYVPALVVGFAVGILALILNHAIAWFWKLHSPYAQQQRDLGRNAYLGAWTGLILGILYLLGGPDVRFSGSIGIGLLTTHAADFTIAGLVGLIVLKLIVTAFSKAAGYRGGLVFPSVFIGITVGLLALKLFPEWGAVGAILGAIAGVLSAVTEQPLVAGLFVVAILPFQGWGSWLSHFAVALMAILGTVAARQLTHFLRPRAPARTAAPKG